MMISSPKRLEACAVQLRFCSFWCPFVGHKNGCQKPTETYVFEFSYLCMNSSLEELIKIKVIFILRQGMFR